MKILKISGRNLASLSGDFAIDFEQEPLASAGLFAISGPTGAGKSTLLDALCLALYDATPRLQRLGRGASVLPDVGTETVSAQDPRTLLRRGASEGWAEVDFVGNDQLRYRARWSVRRSRGKASGGLQKASMTLHQLPAMLALGATKTEVLVEIVQRVGLTFEQFTRAVLLAQNEFSAFLKTEENERGELLETLTGSDIYSSLSRRAYERCKAEKAALQQLGARLADHTPLAAEARTALEAECASAEAALAQADARQGALDQQLRWHQEAARLAASEAQAEMALTLAQSQASAASERRRRLEALLAAQPARGLLAESARLEHEAVALHLAAEQGTAELARVTAVQELANAALTQAATEVQAGEHALRLAAPLLDQAKALDATIAALLPSQTQAGTRRDAADTELAAATDTLRQISLDLQATGEAQRIGAAWLDQHQRWEQLAVQWPRWEALFAQAARQALNNTRLDSDSDTALAARQDALDKEAQAAASLAISSTQLTSLEVRRQQALAAMAACELDQLQQQRQDLDRRRSELAAGERTWTALASAGERLEQLAAATRALAAADAASTAQIDAARVQAPALGAALAQAERSLKAAELACADSVEDLRATLVDAQPCPVCGSAEHPYQHQNAVLHALLARLNGEVDHCRAQVQDNLALQASQQAALAATEQQLRAVREEVAELETVRAHLAASWQALPIAAQAAPAPACGAWLASQAAELQTELASVEAREAKAREAAAARDAAQRASDAAALEQQQRHSQAASARETLAAAQAVLTALEIERAQGKRALAALLEELDGALSGVPGWIEQWRAAPAPFRDARAAEATSWQAHTAQQQARLASLASLATTEQAAQQRCVLAGAASEAARTDFQRVDTELQATLAQRATLWEGRAVQDVEHGLHSALDAARATLAARQAGSLAASQAETRAREVIAHTGARLIAIDAQLQAAGEKLTDWLANYAKQFPLLEPIAGLPGLQALLAQDDASIAAERQALQAIDASLANAATVLAERRNQAALHRQAATVDMASSEAALQEAAVVLAGERKDVLSQASQLRVLLAQDDVRRSNAQALMGELDKQQAIALRWARMDELIGSFDGKKFRNYAQQFTLDVLLGYANEHLAQLARRYRLERVLTASGPSLGLLVRDQDMGGEIRSVNSLSGGESFLVSLALALGLASLSSNRVKVESLFIDEGFGSLDSDTLRVAMDALDGLQSLGRKVGVISHVQEMTERIATRIVVQPKGAGASSVIVQ